MISHNFITNNMKRDCMRCSTGKFLILLLISGMAFLMLSHASSIHSVSDGLAEDIGGQKGNGSLFENTNRLGFWRKPPRLPPRFSPDKMSNKSKFIQGSGKVETTASFRQQEIKKAFVHAWSGYKQYAMGYDELMPLSKTGVDGLGGLGATVVDALDTAMIMGLDDVVFDAGSWIETHLPDRINEKGQVNLFETTIRVVGGLLSAYHLSGGEEGKSIYEKGPKPIVYLENARNLADRLLTAFTESPTAIPYSDVVLRDHSAHAAPDGLSSTSEASTLQLEFNYLSDLTGDPKYSLESMKVLEHMKNLPKVEGLVPIYIRYGLWTFLVLLSLVAHTVVVFKN